jgi:hypothetical protein
MEMYIIALMVIMGGFGTMLLVSEVLYELLKFIVHKLEERERRNANE